MQDQFKGFFGFWRGVYSEDDGQGSATRVWMGATIATGLFIAIYLTILTKHVDHLVMVTGFVTGISAPLYAANRYFNNKDSSVQPPNPPTQP